MKRFFHLSRWLSCSAIFANLSCQKELHFSTAVNTPPVVHAGFDTTNYVDRIYLQGSATDKESNTLSFLLNKIEGPAGETIVNPGEAATQVLS